jgi:hypothetical protein
VLLALLILIGLVLGLIPASAQATFAGGNGRLVIDGNAGIETLRFNGSDVTKVADPGVQATWSPDGTKILFQSSDGIWVMGADGSSPQRLTDSGFGPVWSPDGQRIVFGKNGTLWLVDADGSDLRPLTEFDPQLNNQDYDPSWSPDGDRLAFTRQVSRQSTSASEVWTVNADGTNPKRLTPNTLQDFEPQWAPDGSRIVVDRMRFILGTWGGPVAIWSLNPDGSDPRQLTHPTSVQEDDREPRWSPDATRIAYSHDGTNPTDPGIYVMQADGSNPQRLTDPGGGLVWSPDGTRIAFTRQYNGGFPNMSTSLSVVGADGSEEYELLQRSGFAGIHADWQARPFGPVAPSPAGVTFDRTPVTAVTGARTVTLTNGGQSGVSVDGVALTGAEAGNFKTTDDTCTGAALAPGAACTVGARFAPASLGPHRAVLEFREGGGASTQRVGLLGTGLSPVVLDPSAVDFEDTPYGTHSDDTVTLTNVGAADLAVGQVALGGRDPERFSTFDDACSGADLASGEQCTVGVRFAPTQIGKRLATLVFGDDAVDAPHVVPLSGSGISPVALSPSHLAYGSVVWGEQSAARTVDLTNRGATDLHMGTVTLAGSGAGSFVLGADSCSGATVAPGASCQADVRFVPDGLGARAATLRFADDAADSPQSLPLSGTGISPVALTPLSVVFPSVPDHFEGARRMVTLTNVGAANLTVNGVAVTGTDASSFVRRTDTCTGHSFTKGQSCSVVVRFRPLGAGAKTASLQFSDSAIDSPQAMALSGTGTPGAWLEPSPAALKFGHVRVGTSTPAKTVTLTNAGSLPLSITAITKEGANPTDFHHLTETCTAMGTLNPGQTCSASIRFRPTATGTRSATLTITDSAPRNPHHIALNGTGS